MKSTIGAIIIVALFLLGAVGYAIEKPKFSKTHAKVVAINTNTSSIDSSSASGLSISDQSTGVALGTQTTIEGGNAEVQGLGTTSSSSSSPTLPGPETFTQYNKYSADTTASYIDYQPGNGAEATNSKTLSVVYKGWLTNGKLFDQSQTDKDGKLVAYSFILGEHKVILGWEQGLSGMRVGGYRRLIIPPSAGYGVVGYAPIIPANALLIFDVQLVEVN